MLGLDVYNGSRAQLTGFGATAQVTFPLLQMAADNTNSFSREDLLVVAPDGTIRFWGHVASATARKSAQEVVDALLANRPLVQPILSSLFFDRVVPYGEIRTTKMTLQNIGSAPLEVTHLQTDVGNFTSPDLPIIVAPGASEIINILFTADSFDDVVGNMIFFSNTDPFEVKITPITVQAPPPVLTLTQTTVDFGSFDLARSPQKQLTIQNNGQGPLVISNIQSNLIGLIASPNVTTLAPGESTDITLSIKTTQTGMFSETLQIISNDPMQPTTSIRLSGTAQVIPPEPQADANGNGTIDFPDFLTFAQSFGNPHPTLDFNNNGTVDFPDFLTFAQSFGKTIN
ncbi:MAG: hypothetical protein ACI8V2_001003 [Candidatus Latescibacterota bacterium]|jgi:hypothetical protein